MFIVAISKKEANALFNKNVGKGCKCVILVFLAIVLLFSFAGCSKDKDGTTISKDDTKGINKVIEEFFGAIREQDYETASQYLANVDAELLAKPDIPYFNVDAEAVLLPVVLSNVTYEIQGEPEVYFSGYTVMLLVNNVNIGSLIGDYLYELQLLVQKNNLTQEQIEANIATKLKELLQSPDEKPQLMLGVKLILNKDKTGNWLITSSYDLANALYGDSLDVMYGWQQTINMPADEGSGESSDNPETTK